MGNARGDASRRQNLIGICAPDRAQMARCQWEARAPTAGNEQTLPVHAPNEFPQVVAAPAPNVITSRNALIAAYVCLNLNRLGFEHNFAQTTETEASKPEMPSRRRGGASKPSLLKVCGVRWLCAGALSRMSKKPGSHFLELRLLSSTLTPVDGDV